LPILQRLGIGERECDEGEPKLLETIVGCVVSLLPVAPDRSSGELSSGRGYAYLPFVSSCVSTTPEHEGGDYTKLLAGANLRTLKAPQRFVNSSDSSDHLGVNIAEAKVDSAVRTSVPIMTNATTTIRSVDFAAIAKERLVSSLVFGGDSSSAGRSHPIFGGFSDRTSGDFLIDGTRYVVDPDSNLQRVYVPHWNVTNGFCMDDGGVYREMVDEFPPPKFFASIRGTEHDQLFTKFNVGAARQISLGAEEAEAAEVVRLRDEAQALKERNTILEKEKSELEVKVTDLAALVKVREQEVADLDIVVTPVKLQNDSLADLLEASSTGLQEKVTVCENCMSQLEKFEDEKMKEVNEKFNKLCVDFVVMALHLEEKIYPHLLTTIFEHRWLLTHGMELAIAKCLNSTEYLSTLGATIGKTIKKGMQEGLSTGITHGAGDRTLTDVAAYNPSAEADYLSALQRLQSTSFPLIVELKTNKDASVEVIMNLLRLEDTHAESWVWLSHSLMLISLWFLSIILQTNVSLVLLPYHFH
nr:hypothetical protein [Tanacetum cinerariifolium]